MTNTASYCCSRTEALDCAERASCEVAGTPGHTQCGSCAVHGKPVHVCGCVRTEESRNLDDFLLNPSPEALEQAWAELEALLSEG